MQSAIPIITVSQHTRTQVNLQVYCMNLSQMAFAGVNIPSQDTIVQGTQAHTKKLQVQSLLVHTTMGPCV